MKLTEVLKFLKFAPIMGKPSLIFNSLEEIIHVHPVVFFHDVDEGMYYYLKARSASKTVSEKEKIAKFGEVLVPKSTSPEGLFIRDSYIDCSQIFMISEYQLDEFLKRNQQIKISNLQELDHQYVKRIFGKLWECLKAKPPYVVFSEVKYDRIADKTSSEVLYASNEHLDNDFSDNPQSRKKGDEEQLIIKKLSIAKKTEISSKHRLHDLEEIYNKAEEIYLIKKIAIPLAEWVLENETKLAPWNKRNLWTSKYILDYVNSLFSEKQNNPETKLVIPEPVGWKWLAKGCHIINQTELLKTIQERDFRYMLDWMKERKLQDNINSLEAFRGAMQKNQKDDVFFYAGLKEKLQIWEQERPIREEAERKAKIQKIKAIKEVNERMKKQWKAKTKDDDGWSQGM